MIKSDEYKIFFCGISKNCHKTIENNLKFISDFVKTLSEEQKAALLSALARKEEVVETEEQENPEAEKEDFDNKLQELQSHITPIMQKIYSNNSDVKSNEDMPATDNPMDMDEGPKIEEID